MVAYLCMMCRCPPCIHPPIYLSYVSMYALLCIYIGERHGDGKYKVKGGEFVDGHWEHGAKVTSDQKNAHHATKKDHEKHHNKKKD